MGWNLLWDEPLTCQKYESHQPVHITLSSTIYSVREENEEGMKKVAYLMCNCGGEVPKYLLSEVIFYCIFSLW